MDSSPTPSPVPSRPLAVPLIFPLVGRDHVNHNYGHSLRLLMLVLASTFGVVMFLFTISTILRNCYSRRRNHSRRNSPILFDVHGDSPFSDDEGPAIDHPIWFIRTVGLPQSVIDSITICKYSKEEGLIEGTECSVCLNEFQQDESLRLLPKCSHAFHIPCIDTWLRSHKNCPLCRAPVARDSGGAEVSATEPDSNISGHNEDTQMDGGEGNHQVGESESSELRIGDDDSGVVSSEEGRDHEIPEEILPSSDKMNCHSPILIGSQEVEVEVEEEIQPMRRSVSVDASSASVIFRDVVDFLNSEVDSSETHFDDKRYSGSKDIAIAKQGSGSSTVYKLASIGRALQKRPISFRRPFSQNRKFLFSRHCRSHSSTLPL